MIRPNTPAAFEPGLRGHRARLIDDRGASHDLAVERWSATADAHDLALTDRCVGPTLDIGCGPGRLTAALAQRGVVALGVDVSHHAVALTRARGATALRRDVFALTLGRGRWRHLVLADGNIGIGGDPVRLLARCRELMDPTGSVLLDLDPPGTGLVTATVRLASQDRLSDPFPWAWLGVDGLADVASAAGLRVAEVWSPAPGRWQAELTVAGGRR